MTSEDKDTKRPDPERRQTDRRTPVAAEMAKQSKGLSIWLIFSFAITPVIIGWGFSLPFRKHERPLLIWDESDVPGREDGSVRKVKMTQEQINAYREDAIQRDREFLRERRERLRHSGNLPGHEEAKKAELQRIDSVKKTIVTLRDAPKGSLQEQYRKDLEKSLDMPQ